MVLAFPGMGLQKQHRISAFSPRGALPVHTSVLEFPLFIEMSVILDQEPTLFQPTST